MDNINFDLNVIITRQLIKEYFKKSYVIRNLYNEPNSIESNIMCCNMIINYE